MKKTLIAKKFLAIFLVLCFLLSPLTPGIDYRAEAATVSDTQDEIFDEFEISIASEKATAKVGNKRVGYYWAASAKSGKNYITSYYYSKTKSGKGKVLFSKKFNYSDYFDDSDFFGSLYGATYQCAYIYTNGKNCYFMYDLYGTGYADVYYGSVGKKVKKISKLSEDFNPEDVFMVYDNKLYYYRYYSFQGGGTIDKGEIWDNDRDVVTSKNYVYDPKVGKPKRIMRKYDWIGTTGRYLFCHYFSKLEPGEWGTEWGTLEPYQEPDYPVYDESKVLVYDCKTGKVVKTLTGESFGLGSRKFEDRQDLWSENYDYCMEYPDGCYDDLYTEYPEDYYNPEGRILFQIWGDKLILKALDTVVIADELGNVIKTIPNAKGYLCPLNNEDDMFAAIYGTRCNNDEDVCPESITIYDYEGSIHGKAEIEEGQVLTNLTKNYAYTIPLEPEKTDNGNFKLKACKYDLKNGNKTVVLNTNVLGKSDVKKAFTKKGKIGYITMESLFFTTNYVYWSAEYSMHVKYNPDINFSTSDEDPETVFYRFDKRTNKKNKISGKTYDIALEKYGWKTGVTYFEYYRNYKTGQSEFYRG